MSGLSNGPAMLVGGEQDGLTESFNLQVVSPSAGVHGPLSFPRLSTRTTVKQLKEKIRETLPIRPPDDHQRLIHQGRLLARDAETMLEIFGQDKVRQHNHLLPLHPHLLIPGPAQLKNVDIQTLHLVLRPATSETTAPPNASALPNHQGDTFIPR